MNPLSLLIDLVIVIFYGIPLIWSACVYLTGGLDLGHGIIGEISFVILMFVPVINIFVWIAVMLG